MFIIAASVISFKCVVSALPTISSSQTDMGVGRGAGGAEPPIDFEIFRKKVAFLVSSGKNQISPLLPPL